jgi:hypothetical protein
MTKRKAMTEAQWLASDDPGALLHYLRQHRGISRAPGNRRRFRLFACACCRRQWQLFTDEHCRRAVEVSERAADGRASRKELAEVHHTARARAAAVQERVQLAASGNPGGRVAGSLLQEQWVMQAAEWTAIPGGGPRAADIVAGQVALAVGSAHLPGDTAAFQTANQAEHCAQADLLRDIFGNPFQPVAVDGEWLSAHRGAAATMARTIYEERRFNELPILADALEEAACPSPALIAHCRGAGPHTRGCWTLDLLLANS